MGLFGRRKPEEGSELPKYLIPPEVWDDPKIGGVLKMLGKKPDDPDNLTITPADVERMVAEGKVRIARMTREINDKLAAGGARGARVQPFWLIQDNCWGGEVGLFLIYVLRLNPYDDWNVVYLPEDEAGSAILDLPMHPGAAIPALSDYGEQHILQLKSRLMEALAEAERSFDFGAYDDAHKQTVASVKALAEYFSALLVEAHDKSKARRN